MKTFVRMQIFYFCTDATLKSFIFTMATVGPLLHCYS